MTINEKDIRRLMASPMLWAKRVLFKEGGRLLGKRNVPLNEACTEVFAPRARTPIFERDEIKTGPSRRSSTVSC